MDSVVTARVPVEIKNQGNAALRRIGATPTRLINAAYEYVLATGKLPEVAAAGQVDAQGDGVTVRKPTREQEQDLLNFMRETTMEAPEGFWDGLSLKEYLARERTADYEALG